MRNEGFSRSCAVGQTLCVAVCLGKLSAVFIGALGDVVVTQDVRQIKSEVGGWRNGEGVGNVWGRQALL